MGERSTGTQDDRTHTPVKGNRFFNHFKIRFQNLSAYWTAVFPVSFKKI